ncbi:MAG: hypothetical protein JWR63_1788 [Conexibacter sp.]|nr:hypothetical protein [Conexibacter sp.]
MRSTRALASGARRADHHTMASLPALPSLGTLLRTKDDNNPSATDLAAQVDAKLTLARRLRDEEARRRTSIAPPSRRAR